MNHGHSSQSDLLSHPIKIEPNFNPSLFDSDEKIGFSEESERALIVCQTEWKVRFIFFYMHMYIYIYIHIHTINTLFMISSESKINTF